MPTGRFYAAKRHAVDDVEPSKYTDILRVNRALGAVFDRDVSSSLCVYGGYTYTA